MKNLFKLLGITALVVVIGFSMIACKDSDDSKTDTSLNGTWVDGDKELYLNKGNWEMSDGGTPSMKGTFTTSGSDITITLTHVNGDYAELSESKWYDRNDFKNETGLGDGEVDLLFFTEKGTYSISDNKLTLKLGDDPSQTYTKK